MPYPNYHSCRLKEPGRFSEFRYKSQNGADVIMGKVKNTDSWEVQAIRYPKESWEEARARENCSSHSGSFDAASGEAKHSEHPPDSWEGLPLGKFEDEKKYARTLRNVDIFKTGKWNGDQYDEKDLDEIVQAFYKLPFKVPVKLGHTEAQRWFGQEDGAPALGWVSNPRRDGGTLRVDIENVPDIVAALITNGNYTGKSAEIYWNYKDPAGNVWPRALKAVSLLGADMPAVSTLEDLRTALMSVATNSSIGPDGSKEEVVVKSYDFSNATSEPDGGNMDTKRYEEMIASLESKLNAEKALREQMESRAVKAEATLASRDEEHATKMFREQTLVTLKKEGKVLPAEEESLCITYSSLGAGSRKYGDKEVNPREVFVKSLHDRKPYISTREMGAGGDDDIGGDTTPAVEVDRRIRKFIEDGLAKTYPDGKDLVKLRYPNLWERYIRG